MTKKIVLLLIFIFSSSSLLAQNEASYKKMLKKYHKVSEEYSQQNFHALFKADVLYLSPELLLAQKSYLEKKYPDSAQEYLERNRSSASGSEFLLFFYTYNKKWNDLEKVDSIWQLRLQTSAGEFSPLSVEKIKPNVLDEDLYPYFAPWVVFYKIRFAESVGNNPQLKVFGVKGKGSLSWNVSE